MKFSLSEILPVVESTGFKVEMVEKVFHLLNLLNTLNSHPFLKGKWVLKGGSALNLAVAESYVPEPSTFILLILGLLGIVGIKKRMN